MRSWRTSTRIAVGALTIGAAAAWLAPGAEGRSRGQAFRPPVKLTIEQGFGGYEPGLVLDRFNNVFVTAHKSNHGLVVSPDSRATTEVRSQSWLWTSSDGVHFDDMPGQTPLQEQNLEFGDEGDVAMDDTGHLYFVDTNVADVTFSRYSVTGPGTIALEATRPVAPAAEAVDDRPWVTAHGDGVVMYAGNQGDKASYPLASSGHPGNANGPGRYTIYMSSDHGDTFDPVGYTLKDSGWCRPAADHARGSKRLYMICTNDNNGDALNQNGVGDAPGPAKLFSYVSEDDGTTWNRYEIGPYNGSDPWTSWPSVSIAKDGTLYALYINSDTAPGSTCSFVDDQTVGCDDTITGSHLMVYRSRDHGRTWQSSEVVTNTPGNKGLIRYGWLSVTPTGKIGVAYYFRPNVDSDWHVMAATGSFGGTFDSGLVAAQPVADKTFGSPLGDFFECAFGPDGKLNVVWTSLNADIVTDGINSDIYFARQR
jgi:hypothetical protein